MITLLRKLRYLHIFSGKFRNYLLYAIGEILLVVVGILIALQVNTLNQQKKEKEIVKNNIPILIENLLLDSIELSNNLKTIDAEENFLKRFKQRLESQNANLDTLKFIVQNEFSPIVGVKRIGNNQAYQTLVNSGEINLFNKTIIQDIYNYYTTFYILNLSDDEIWNSYVQSILKMQERYTIPGGFIESGPIYEAIWQNANIETLGPKFNNWANAKRVYLLTIRRYLETLLIENARLTGKLRFYEKEY